MEYLAKFLFSVILCSIGCVVTSTQAFWFFWGLAACALTVLPMGAVLEGIADALEDLDFNDFDWDD
jgi:hypothetical protein